MTTVLSLRFARAAVLLAAAIGAASCAAPPIVSEGDAPAIVSEGDGPADCPAIGEKCPDGAIYAGRSPDTGTVMFAMPEDVPYALEWDQAAAAFGGSRRRDDWRLPTTGELGVLFANRGKGALKGTFNETGSYPAGWYWSSAPYRDGFAWGVRLRDGDLQWNYKYDKCSVRLVRSAP